MVPFESSMFAVAVICLSLAGVIVMAMLFLDMLGLLRCRRFDVVARWLGLKDQEVTHGTNRD